MSTEEKININYLSFRVAQHDDKAELMTMSEDVYDGLDYLPAFYDQWIREADQKQPKRFNFVGVLEDQLVAFFSLLFLSEKASVIESAVRIHPNFRGLGIFKKMSHFSTSFVKSLTTSCWQISSFIDVFVDDTVLARMKASKGEEVLKRSAILLTFDPKCWIHHRKALDDSTREFFTFEMVGQKFLENVLEDDYWRSLLINGVLHINWDPYVPGSKEDIEYMCSTGLVIVKDAESFSILKNATPVPSGLRVGLDIFCRTFDKFVAHVLNQLDRFARSVEEEEEIKLFIFSPLEWTEDLLRFLKGSCKMEEYRLGGMTHRPWPTMFIYRQKI